MATDIWKFLIYINLRNLKRRFKREIVNLDGARLRWQEYVAKLWLRCRKGVLAHLALPRCCAFRRDNSTLSAKLSNYVTVLEYEPVTLLYLSELFSLRINAYCKMRHSALQNRQSIVFPLFSSSSS